MNQKLNLNDDEVSIYMKKGKGTWFEFNLNIISFKLECQSYKMLMLNENLSFISK